MDQKKIGCFLKELRREKNITQEQLAEKLGVSNRSVSRWETGSNLPDLDLLIQMADYYEVELREILDGERKNEQMNKDMKETVLKVADYSNTEKMRLTKKMNILFIAGSLGFVIYMILDICGMSQTGIFGDIADFSLGLAFGVLVLGVLFTNGYMAKIRTFKLRILNRHQN